MVELLGNFWFLVFACITITSVVGTVAHAWQKVRRTERDADLKSAMLQRGLSVEEMERVLRLTAVTGTDQDAESPSPEPPLRDEQLLEKLTNLLAEGGASAETIQQVMQAFLGADPTHRRLLCHAIFGLSDGIDDEGILAVIRGLCRPAERAGETELNPEPHLALPARADPKAADTTFKIKDSRRE